MVGDVDKQLDEEMLGQFEEITRAYTTLFVNLSGFQMNLQGEDFLSKLKLQSRIPSLFDSIGLIH